MKKTELKKVLKPLIEQCVKEILLEEGLLSSIVSEVVVGFRPLLIENNHISDNQISESNRTQKLLQTEREELEEERQKLIKEHKRKILNATGLGNEIFEGVVPLGTGGSLDETPPNGALTGVDPNDPGVDISALMALGGHKWNKLI